MGLVLTISNTNLCSVLILVIQFHFKMQRNIPSLLLLLFFLGFSSYVVLFASAIPATRTQNLKGQATLSSLAKLEHVQNLGNVEEVLVDVDEGFIERRMNLETQDYEGTGANKDHDPKSPGSG